MAKIKLELVNLRKEFGDLVAVDDVSIAIEESETMALLGPSGCGKSTILNMIVGLEAPTSGDILIDGKSVLNVSPGDRNVGLVFQDYAVFTHMTVRNNLAYGLKVRKMNQTEIDREIAKVAEFLSITHQLDRKPDQLGASELQRVAIGRTLVTNPEILLLDEPLSNLEAAMRNQMRRELRRIQADTGQTIIYVTHDQIEALSLAHRIAVMDFGALQQYDTAHNVYQYPANRFVGSFLGNPPMNFLKGKIGEDGGRRIVTSGNSIIPLPLGNLGSDVSAGADVVVGVRPESLRLAAADDPGSFTVPILAVEPQGPETVVTASFGDSSLKVIVPTGAAAAEGDSIDLVPESDLIALFDAESGVRLLDSGDRR
jgi:multiple sugar transport system ATP-binding protein